MARKFLFWSSYTRTQMLYNISTNMFSGVKVGALYDFRHIKAIFSGLIKNIEKFIFKKSIIFTTDNIVAFYLQDVVENEILHKIICWQSSSNAFLSNF